MPIIKSGGSLVYTPALDFNDFLQTGVIRADQFALCDKIDRVKQINFDTSPQASITSLTLKSGAISSDTIITLPSSSGTLASTSFGIIQPPTGTSPTASIANDTLHLTSNTAKGNIVITGNSSTKTIDIALRNPILDAGAVNSIEWLVARTLYDALGNTSINWNQGIGGRTLYTSTGLGVLNWQSTLLLDTSGGTSIDWNGRVLRYASSVICLDYSLGQGYDSSGVQSIYWTGRYLFDFNDQVSLDWGNYDLNDSLGSPSINWDQRLGFDPNTINSINWGSRVLIDAGSLTSVDWNNYHLVYNNITRIDWQVGILLDAVGTGQFVWDTGGININRTIYHYNGDVTTGNGVSSIVGNVNLVNQASSIGDTTIFTPPAAGMYRLSAYVEVTTAGTAGTLAVQIKYSDDNGAQAVDPLPVSTISLASAGFSQGGVVIRSGGTTAIKYNTTVSGALGTPKYALKLVLERLS